MNNRFIILLARSLLISIVGVFIIDYFAHLTLSEPMETLPYFLTKALLYFIFSILFLRFVKLDRNRLIRVILGGITVSLIWGAYYNVLPALFDYYPFGIALEGLTFLGMGLIGTGLAFGLVHTLAFLGGYYFSELAFD